MTKSKHKGHIKTIFVAASSELIEKSKKLDISLSFGLWKCGKVTSALQVTAAAEAKQRPARNGAEKECTAGNICLVLFSGLVG